MKPPPERATPDDCVAAIRDSPLIESAPSLEYFNPKIIAPGGSIYYGTGLTTPRAISVGLPFDCLGMMLTAESLRRRCGLDSIFHHIADTHAKTNHWISPREVDVVAEKTTTALESVRRNLGLDRVKVVLASSFDSTPEYREVLHRFDSSAEHEYVRRELADIEWYRQRHNVCLKLGWIIQARETRIGFDERRFDREYLRFRPGAMSFIYGKPGRTFDPRRPKVSPYISVEGESRLLLDFDGDVGELFGRLGGGDLGGARRHLQAIVRLYESLFGVIGDKAVPLEEKIQAILARCRRRDANVSAQGASVGIGDVPIPRRDIPLSVHSGKRSELDVGSGGDVQRTTLRFDRILARNAQIVLPERGLESRLEGARSSGKRLRVKMGFDPTSPDLHLGHAVSMQELRRFQEQGHLPVIIIGDFTGRIGDPSGKSKSRPLVDAQTLRKNAQTYIAQLGKVLDTEDIEVHFNSEWLEPMRVDELLGVLAQGTLSQIVSREDFRKRLASSSPIGVHEIVYPFLQGLDSIAVCADVEIGGVDQLYAFQAARTLQANRGQVPEVLIMMPLLRGIDGVQKMSKSLGNSVGLADEPSDMFGKVMSIPDSLLEEYLRLASSFTPEEVHVRIRMLEDGVNPMEIKLGLAENIVATYHSAEVARTARTSFDRQFRSHGNEVYSKFDVIAGTTLLDLVLTTGSASSKNRARRLAQEGAIRINDSKIAQDDLARELPAGARVRIGRRRLYEISVRQKEL